MRQGKYRARGAATPPQDKEADMANYRIHFTDDYGQGAIECDTYEEYREAIGNINADPMCEDIWTESYDPEEGWQA